MNIICPNYYGNKHDVMTDENEEIQRKKIDDAMFFFPPNIFYFRRPKNPSVYQIEYFLQSTMKKLAEKDCRQMIIDLEEASLPSREIGSLMRKHLPQVLEGLDLFVIIAPNQIFELATKFIFSRIKSACEIKIVGSIEEAFEVLNIEHRI